MADIFKDIDPLLIKEIMFNTKGHENSQITESMLVVLQKRYKQSVHACQMLHDMKNKERAKLLATHYKTITTLFPKKSKKHPFSASLEVYGRTQNYKRRLLKYTQSKIR